MAYKMNPRQVENLQCAVRGCFDALNSIKVESENTMTWAPYIEEKVDKLLICANIIKRLADEALEEEKK